MFALIKLLDADDNVVTPSWYSCINNNIPTFSAKINNPPQPSPRADTTYHFYILIWDVINADTPNTYKVDLILSPNWPPVFDPSFSK